MDLWFWDMFTCDLDLHGVALLQAVRSSLLELRGALRVFCGRDRCVSLGLTEKVGTNVWCWTDLNLYVPLLQQMRSEFLI